MKVIKEKRRAVYVNDAQWQFLAELAKQKETTISSLIREAVKFHLERKYQKI